MAELIAGLQARVIETLPPSMGYIAGLVESLLETSSLMVLTLLGPVLLRLYLHGPSLWNFGFWASVSPLEICNRISTAAPEFWIARADACQDLIFARFHGFFLGWCALGYLVILVLMIPWALRAVPWALGLVPWALGLVPWTLGLVPWTAKAPALCSGSPKTPGLCTKSPIAPGLCLKSPIAPAGSAQGQH